jgi:hypothetical protein
MGYSTAGIVVHGVSTDVEPIPGSSYNILIILENFLALFVHKVFDFQLFTSQ